VNSLSHSKSPPKAEPQQIEPKRPKDLSGLTSVADLTPPPVPEYALKKE